MKTIAYYISDYGYGHATRSIAIIRTILKIDSTVRIIICHSFALGFIQRSLNSKRVIYRQIKTDVGYYLKDNSIEPDIERLNNKYKLFIEEMDLKSKLEQDFLMNNKVNIVLSDISPLAFKAAEKLGIPSMGISNFTWYTAYQGLIPDSLLSVLKEYYQKMTYFISLAGSQEKYWVYTKEFNYGFFSREIDLKEVKRIKMLVNPKGNKKIIFVGIGMKIETLSIENLPLWNSDEVVFLVSSNVEIERRNIHKIPDDYLESQNYIAASNLLITKAGWGMLGEAVNSNVPILILDRKSMKEDQNTIQFMKSNYECQTIEWDEFQKLTIKDLNFFSSKKVNRKTMKHSNDIAILILNILYEN